MHYSLIPGITSKWKPVPVTPDDLEKTKQYVKERALRGDYEKYKRNRSAVKPEKDDRTGKIGEFGFFRAFPDQNLTLPDTSVYEDEEKRFDYDLRNDSYTFSVKSVSVHNNFSKYPVSFLFNTGSSGPDIGYDPIKQDFVAFVLVDEDKMMSQVIGILPSRIVKKYLKPPIKKDLEKYKIVFYFSDYAEAYREWKNEQKGEKNENRR